MTRLLITAESGSDLTPEMALEMGVTIVPMHVALGTETYDDGSIPVENVFNHYKDHKQLPRTSGCTPEDFMKAFSGLRDRYPGVHILHLAYSSVTTCSMQSAIIAREELGMENDITILDTKSVTAGQAIVIMAVCDFIKANPDASLSEIVSAAEEIISRAKMGFVPGDLEYLRAGGRVSNAAYLGAKLLGIHPLIEILDGKLISTRKYRGTMGRVAVKMAQDFVEANDLSRDRINLIYNMGLAQSVRDDVEKLLKSLGFKEMRWIHTGCVISSHCGPGSFGLAGLAKKA